MNYSEVIELLHAGFNADEIRSMINPQNPQNNLQEPAKQEPVTPEPAKQEPVTPEPAKQEPVTPEPAKQEAAQGANVPDDPRFNQLNDTMGKILSAIQAGNLAKNSFDKMGDPSDINTEVDKIMQGLIRPETGGNKNVG